jgi:hypothetical protein
MFHLSRTGAGPVVPRRHDGSKTIARNTLLLFSVRFDLTLLETGPSLSTQFDLDL